jgi:16S rRNA (cytidine1402-2'-O)-methyltransferase
VGTPIGNLGDLSDRMRETLRSADHWIVEDSRVSGKLASVLEVRKPMRVLNEHTPPGTIARYVDEIASGTWAALVTDGGMPSISDPGALLTDACHDRGISVEGIPGPSAVVTALALSGFFGQRFAFMGFLGRKNGAIRSELEPFAESPYTIVIFESPFRVANLLGIAAEVLGNRRYALCREITKLHEQVYRATLPEIPSEETVPHRGEFTVVFEGKRKRNDGLVRPY